MPSHPARAWRLQVYPHTTACNHLHALSALKIPYNPAVPTAAANGLSGSGRAPCAALLLALPTRSSRASQTAAHRSFPLSSDPCGAPAGIIPHRVTRNAPCLLMCLALPTLHSSALVVSVSTTVQHGSPQAACQVADCCREAHGRPPGLLGYVGRWPMQERRTRHGLQLGLAIPLWSSWVLRTALGWLTAAGTVPIPAVNLPAMNR